MLDPFGGDAFGGSPQRKAFEGSYFSDNFNAQQEAEADYQADKRRTEAYVKAQERAALQQQRAQRGQRPSAGLELGKAVASAAVPAAVTAGIALI